MTEEILTEAEVASPCPAAEDVTEKEITEAAPSRVETLQAEKEALAAELAALRAEMEQQQRRQAVQEEFRSLYPETDPSTLPREVLESELPLSAAYAIYCRRQERQRLIAEEKNEQNRSLGSGAVRHDGVGDGEFTVEEIRRMSPAAVRQNYSGILRSLKKHK